MAKLTDIMIKNAKVEPGKKRKRIFDGQGLYLEVHENESKYFRYKFRFGTKEKTMALGVYPEVKLREARARHQKAKLLVSKGIDPIVERKADLLTLQVSAQDSFYLVGEEWAERHFEGKSKSHIDRTKGLLKKYIYPDLGYIPIAEITAVMLLGVLRKMESKGFIDSVHKARSVLSGIYVYAIATQRVDRNLVLDIAPALRPKRVTHYPAITEAGELAKLLRAIEGSTSGVVVKAALKISPILFQRPGEIRSMEWAELDLEKGLWTIPLEKTKTRQVHDVPLPRQVVEEIKGLRFISGKGKYVFPSPRGGSRCMSENGVRTALRSLGYDNSEITPHGFRATARTMLDEVLGFPAHLIEHQLSHAVRDPNGRAYNRTTFRDDRAHMMQVWADYLDALRCGEPTDKFVQPSRSRF